MIDDRLEEIDKLLNDNNLLDKYTDYSHTKIISVGNNLVARLEFLFNTNAYSHAEQLVKNSLEQAFLHDENFDFQYIKK